MRSQLLTLCCAAALLAGPLAAAATAGEATLWVCHGPGGQALGGQPLVAASSGDALITTYGSGCMAPVSALADGGVRAAFTRPDPTGGSQAFWRLDVPSAVTLHAARLARRTSGFGGAPAPGGGQSYVAQTSSGALEVASVEDASNVALDGVLDSDPATGTYVRLGVRCTAAALTRCSAPSSAALAVDAGSIAVRVGDGVFPSGAVGGITSPAAGTLGLSVFATDGGLGLASTQATLDGALVALQDLGGASCAELSPQDATIDLPATADCPASVSGVPLTVDTTRVPDGPHALRVSVRDVTGNATVVADEQIAVRNTVKPASNSALLSIGAGSGGVPGPGAGAGGGSGAGGGAGGGGGSPGAGIPGPAAAAAQCRRPRLSMRLRSRPLRTKRAIPVLHRGFLYRYAGRLTCVAGGRRVSAPRGTRVEVLSVIGKRIRRDRTVAVGAKGAIAVRLRYNASRVVRFRHRSVDGTTARVSIRIAIARGPLVRR